MYLLRTGYWNKKGKWMLRAGYGNKRGKGILRAGYGIKWIFNAASSLDRLCNTKVVSK